MEQRNRNRQCLLLGAAKSSESYLGPTLLRDQLKPLKHCRLHTVQRLGESQVSLRGYLVPMN